MKKQETNVDAYCIKCNKNFIGKRDHNFNTIKCPRCKNAKNVVIRGHPYYRGGENE